jgi:DNA-binding XRE family transcriptional regulator
MDKQYQEELKKAKKMLAVHKAHHTGEEVKDEWEEMQREFFTPAEIAESDLRVALIAELIEARNEKGITQKQLEELSGVRQPVIARMERGNVNSTLSTVLKVLAPLGKTLRVVPIER